MRFLVVLVLLANVGLLAWGQGFFGTPPADQGRERRTLTERNEQSVIVSHGQTNIRRP
jgi:hypothetical protein